MADKVKQSVVYHVLMTLTKILTILAVITLIPYSGVSKECALGYKALCSFAPYSTLVLLALAGVNCRIRSRFFKKR